MRWRRPCWTPWRWNSAMDGVAHRRSLAAAARVLNRIPVLARGRKPETLPVTLDRRRIYIVPTRAGFGFGLVLAVVLFGALNYQNNAAMLLTCMLGDRKSTRLNSSHPSISYAVFCLKKKRVSTIE